MRYADCETVEDVEAINPVYWEDGGSGDMEGGCWLYQLPSLKNGDDMFSATKLAVTYNGRISLWKFVGNLQSLESGVDMFAGCALDYESVRRIADTLPTVTTGTITIGMDHALEVDTATQEALAVIAGKGWTVEDEYNNYNLPYGFEELDYLETSGTQYIKVPHKFNDLTGLQMKMMPLTNTGSTYNWPFAQFLNIDGVYKGNRMECWATGFASYPSAPTYKTFRFSTPITDPPFTFSYNYKNSRKAVANGVTSTSDIYAMDSIVDGKTMVFGITWDWLNERKNAYSFAGRYYYIRLSQGEDADMNLIPVLRKSDSVVGMWDAVGNQFYTNAGSGKFGYRIKRTGEEFKPMALRDPYYTAPSGIYARLVAENELDVIADTDMESDVAEQYGYTWFANTVEAYEHFGITLTEEEVTDV